MKLLDKIAREMGYINKKQIPSWKDDFLQAINPIIAVPCNGDSVLVRVRKPSGVEIQECGDISLIEILDDKKRKKVIKKRDIRNYVDTQMKILNACLVSPTYDQLMEWAGSIDFVKETTRQYEECKNLLSRAPSGPERLELEESLDALYIKSRLILPADFIGSIMSFVFEIDNSDIKKITKKMLYEAALLAKAGKDNPSDHLHGKFTDFNKEDINKRAWTIFFDEQEKLKKRSGNGGRRR